MKNANKPQSFNSVAFTCDFLRAQFHSQSVTNAQLKNLVWLERLIGAKSTWKNWAVKTSVITAPTQAHAFRCALGDDTIFSRYLHDADHTWASLYDVDELQVFPEILEKLLEHDLIVGFELPPALKRKLDKAGKSYISFYIHPLRFLRDLCFMVTTNSEDIAQLISQDEVEGEEIDYQVRRFSALFSRLEQPALSLPNNVPIIIGQTERDSVLIRRGKFSTWEDYEKNLTEILSPYSEVIFLEHPYRQNSALSTEYFRGKHGKTVMSVRGNSYGIIFSQIEPPFFLTLSSSLGAEARAAGRDCIFLSDDPCKKFILDDVDIPNMVMVSHAVLQDKFWKNIFSGNFSKKKFASEVAAKAFPLGDNYIRNSLDSWAFRPLQSGNGLDPVLKRILPAPGLIEKRLIELNTDLCAGSITAANQVISQGRTQQPWGIVENFGKPFCLGQQSEIDFSHPSALHYLIDGFHIPEDWGVWSSGLYSRLIIPVDLSGAIEANIEISMSVKIYPEILVQAPVLQILINGEEVGIILFRKSMKSERVINFISLIKNPICQIEFLISHTGSPAFFGKSLDHRELGFALCNLSVDISSVPEEDKNKNVTGNTGKFWGVSLDEDIFKDAEGRTA